MAAFVTHDVRVHAEVIDRFDASADPGAGLVLAFRTSRWALHWAALVDAEVPLPDGPSDPFAPLVLMFERGGGFTLERGFVDLASSMVLRKSLQDALSPQPYASLDIATLDNFDTL